MGDNHCSPPLLYGSDRPCPAVNILHKNLNPVFLHQLLLEALVACGAPQVLITLIIHQEQV